MSGERRIDHSQYNEIVSALWGIVGTSEEIKELLQGDSNETRPETHSNGPEDDPGQPREATTQPE
jgi:hypothetical protein